MKYLSIIFVMVGLVFIFSAAKHKIYSQTETNISIQVRGLTGGKVYLIGIHKNVKSKVDSAMIDTEGNFNFKIKEGLKPGAYLVNFPDSTDLKILVDKDQDFALTTSANNLLGNMEVEGSLENELLFNNLQYQRQIETQLYGLQEQIQQLAANGQDYSNLITKGNELYKNRASYAEKLCRKYPRSLFAKMTKADRKLELPENLVGPSVDPNAKQYYLRHHFWDQVDFSDARLLRTPVIFNKLMTYLYQMTPVQTDSMIQAVDHLMAKVQDYPEYYRFFAEWITADYRPNHSPVMDPEALYIHMVNTYLIQDSAEWMDSISAYAWQVRAKDRSHGLIGSTAADIMAKDPNGQMRSLYDLTSPYTILYFYNPDCSHCIEEAPKMVQFYEMWKGRGLEVLAVALYTEESEWKDFISQNNMNWINVRAIEETDIDSKYYVEGTPEIYLINPERKVIGKHLNIEEIQGVVQMDYQNRVNKQITTTN